VDDVPGAWMDVVEVTGRNEKLLNHLDAPLKFLYMWRVVLSIGNTARKILVGMVRTYLWGVKYTYQYWVVDTYRGHHL
jgi:hypothetical protein